MGIPGLTKALNDHLKDKTAIQVTKLENYSGKRMAIDVNIYLHGFAYNPLQKKPNSHIDGFFQMICDLLKAKVTPIMVLDGKPPKAKDETIVNRATLKQENKDKVALLEKEIDALMLQIEVETDEVKSKSLIGSVTEKQTELEKYVKRDIVIQSTMYGDLVELFKYMGVPCLQANGEADALCVRLYKEGHIVAVLSEDMDILTGATLIRGIKDKRTMIITEYNLEKINVDLGFTSAEMIDLCILCGCDYSVKLQGIAAKTGISLITKYRNIETIIKDHLEPDIKKCEKNNPTKATERTKNLVDFKANYLEARRILAESYKEETTPEIGGLNLGSLNQTQLLPFLMEKCRYKPETLAKKMNDIKASYAKG